MLPCLRAFVMAKHDLHVLQHGLCAWIFLKRSTGLLRTENSLGNLEKPSNVASLETFI